MGLRHALLAGGVAVAALATIAMMAPINPARWSPPPDAIAKNACAVAPVLRTEILAHDLPGRPDGLAFAPDGDLRVALSTGKVVSVSVTSGAWRIVAAGSGQLTGLAVTPEGRVFAADERGGRLLGSDREGKLHTLLDGVEGHKLKWANDVAALKDGQILFTTTALGRSLDDFYPEVLSHRATGRLILFDPVTGTTRTLARDLHMANGVAVDANATHALVAETAMYGVRRISLTDGATSHLYGLPGFVGNLRASDRPDIYWITLLSPRSPLIDGLAGWPLARRLLYWLPSNFRPRPQPLPCVIRLRAKGAVMDAQAFRIGAHAPLTSFSTAIERAGRLYLTPASIVEGAPRAVYRADLPEIP